MMVAVVFELECVHPQVVACEGMNSTCLQPISYWNDNQHLQQRTFAEKNGVHMVIFGHFCSNHQSKSEIKITESRNNMIS